MNDKVIEFVRKKDLVFVRELAKGACGQTVILKDEYIDEIFVCKKYSPLHEPMKEVLFENFVREIKLLHLLFHPNIVRVFNYYLYPESHAGYILMEYVNGTDIEEYLIKNPDKINEIFLQTIDGFRYLERHEILHRDIRPQNILVSEAGDVKIIDFGFGKRIATSNDFGKSITLNWWCQPPNEFETQTYDFSTDVYFIGKLFEKIIIEAEIEHFSYKKILPQMCNVDPAERVKSFAKVEQLILSEKLTDITFNDNELDAYRDFATQLSDSFTKIESSAKYYDDPASVEKRLDDAYTKVMLEENVPSTTLISRCFINGSFYYNKYKSIEVACIRRFLELLRSCSRDKKIIVISNLHTRLDAVKRYSDETPDFVDDDIPF